MSNSPAELREAFVAQFGTENTPRLFRAPGRVNLIGEHTDYNDGFVMPAAIQFSTWIAATPRSDRKLVLFSENFSETQEFLLDDDQAVATGHWSDYVRGVALTLERAGHRLCGGNLLIRGEVPIGSGLSSSAALEVASGSALLGISGLTLPKERLALLCQTAENNFVGVPCGIMDQFISCCGRVENALMLDCRSLDFRLLPLPSNTKIVVVNSMVHHDLGEGEYKRRRADCETGVRILSSFIPNIAALRDVTLDDLAKYRPHLSEVVFRRCRHVVSENNRVERAAEALNCGDLQLFGKLMGESHISLRDDYEVSCNELDLLVEIAEGIPGVYGARMTGGGFGGCTVNLVQNEHVENFTNVLSTKYRHATGNAAAIYISHAVNGAEEVSIT